MKNQYFGNRNDYLKYSLLRILSDNGANKIAVCWMLTNNDSHFRPPILAPRELSSLDPILYKALRQSLEDRREYSVSVIQREQLIEGAMFYSEPMQNDGKAREEYFEHFLLHAKGASIVFLDPDRGIEIDKMKGSDREKYIFYDEIRSIYSYGFSVFDYQRHQQNAHLVKSAIENKAWKILSNTQAKEVIGFKAKDVSFFLIPQDDHKERLQARVDEAKSTWEPKITVLKWPKEDSRT